MSEVLITISNWCNENAKTVNTEKTFCQIFTLSHKTTQNKLKIDNRPVVQTQDAEYLGVY
jgi:hypothetical protein